MARSEDLEYRLLPGMTHADLLRAMSAWGIDIRANNLTGEAGEKSESVLPRSPKPKEGRPRIIDLGAKGVSLGRGWNNLGGRSRP